MSAQVETQAPGVSVTIDQDGVATLLIDQPGEKVNVMNLAFIEDLERAIASLDRDLKGVIVASGKEGQFVAGADLHQLLQAQRPEEVAEVARRLSRALLRLASLPYPAVAASNGPATEQCSSLTRQARSGWAVNTVRQAIALLAV